MTLRHYIQQNQQFVTKNELKILSDAIEEEKSRFNERQEKTDSQIAIIQESINKINENFILDTELKNYVILVSGKHRKTGVGRALFYNYVEWCRRNGNEGSLKFHMALGFEEVNRIICFRKDI